MSPKFHVQPLIVPEGIVELSVNFTAAVLQSDRDVKFVTGEEFTIIDLLTVSLQPKLDVTISVIILPPVFA